MTIEEGRMKNTRRI